MNRIAILGAGLSGLNCAKHLETIPNTKIDIFEKTDKIGGRVKTDVIDGFYLDHGFQVFLKNYPEARLSFDYSKLDFYPFSPGAYLNGVYNGDPIREPGLILSGLFSNIGSIKDKILLLKLRFEENKTNFSSIKTTKEFLREYGFSHKIIKNFFTPFFSGVFLNNKLENDPRFFFIFI